MFRMAPFLFVAASLVMGCSRGPDPLAEQRKTCQALADQKALKTGLSVEDCAKQLKARDDAAAPKVEAAAASGATKETPHNP
jgi:hypothetical protein